MREYISKQILSRLEIMKILALIFLLINLGEFAQGIPSQWDGGVSNNQTWCQLLTSINKQLQTINMDQGGAGIDQAYLWYKRDGVKFHHNLKIFAFITDDFVRMQRSKSSGYGKPLLYL